MYIEEVQHSIQYSIQAATHPTRTESMLTQYLDVKGAFDAVQPQDGRATARAGLAPNLGELGPILHLHARSLREDKDLTGP